MLCNNEQGWAWNHLTPQVFSPYPIDCLGHISGCIVVITMPAFSSKKLFSSWGQPHNYSWFIYRQRKSFLFLHPGKVMSLCLFILQTSRLKLSQASECGYEVRLDQLMGSKRIWACFHYCEFCLCSMWKFGSVFRFMWGSEHVSEQLESSCFMRSRVKTPDLAKITVTSLPRNASRSTCDCTVYTAFSLVSLCSSIYLTEHRCPLFWKASAVRCLLDLPVVALI